MYKKDALSYYYGDIFDVKQSINNDQQEISEELLDEQKDKNSDEDGTVFSKLDVAAENEAEEITNNPDELEKVLKEKEIDYDEDLEKKGNYKANNISLNVNKKSGFCYLGEDRGVRTCVQVNDDDTCLSNQVFPTQELCVNPNLKE